MADGAQGAEDFLVLDNGLTAADAANVLSILGQAGYGPEDWLDELLQLSDTDLAAMVKESGALAAMDGLDFDGESDSDDESDDEAELLGYEPPPPPLAESAAEATAALTVVAPHLVLDEAPYTASPRELQNAADLQPPRLQGMALMRWKKENLPSPAAPGDPAAQSQDLYAADLQPPLGLQGMALMRWKKENATAMGGVASPAGLSGPPPQLVPGPPPEIPPAPPPGMPGGQSWPHLLEEGAVLLQQAETRQMGAGPKSECVALVYSPRASPQSQAGRCSALQVCGSQCVLCRLLGQGIALLEQAVVAGAGAAAEHQLRRAISLKAGIDDALMMMHSVQPTGPPPGPPAVPPLGAPPGARSVGLGAPLGPPPAMPPGQLAATAYRTPTGGPPTHVAPEQQPPPVSHHPPSVPPRPHTPPLARRRRVFHQLVADC
jgi:hypothetical protein